jgi:hypothetical protein
MNEMSNARSDGQSNACDAGGEDPRVDRPDLPLDEKLAAHVTTMSAAHTPINAATSDLSRCPFFRALTAATSAFAARPTNLMKTEATKPESTKPEATKPESTKPEATKPEPTKAEARQTDAALQTARAIDSAPRSPSELH